MATVPVYIVVRSSRMNSRTPLIRVRSRRFHNPDDYPFFQDTSIVWHMVMNPVYAAQENVQVAILTAEVDRDSQTTVRIAEKPKLGMAEAKRDLRRLMILEMGVLMEAGNMRLNFIPGTGLADGNGDMVVFDHPLGLQHEWIWYTIRTVHAHTDWKVGSL